LPNLSKQLDIEDEEELEEFLIDAIRAEAINAKIDDLNGQLEITFHQQVLFIYYIFILCYSPVPNIPASIRLSTMGTATISNGHSH
jgi:hypothetical protein